MVASPKEAFAKRLQEALTDRGWDERERGRARYVANICGLKKESGRKWLEGMSMPTMEHAIQIAEELGVCVEWLLTGRGPKKPPSPGTIAHMNAFDILPPESQVHLQAATVAFAQLIPWLEGVNPDRRRRDDQQGAGSKNP
jgi:hypothetical protein